MYAHRSSLGPVDLAFTDRYGGVSAFPFDELNLALESEDPIADRVENHRIVLADFGPEGVVVIGLEESIDAFRLLNEAGIGPRRVIAEP